MVAERCAAARREMHRLGDATIENHALDRARIMSTANVRPLTIVASVVSRAPLSADLRRCRHPKGALRKQASFRRFVETVWRQRPKRAGHRQEIRPRYR